MFNGINHVVIAVEDLDVQVANYERILGMPVSDRRDEPERGMRMAFFRFGGFHIELVSKAGEGGPIAERLERLGEGFHFMALRVDDAQEAVSRLRGEGIRLVNAPPPGEPARGLIFIHPEETGGILIRIMEPEDGEG